MTANKIRTAAYRIKKEDRRHLYGYSYRSFDSMQEMIKYFKRNRKSCLKIYFPSDTREEKSEVWGLSPEEFDIYLDEHNTEKR